MLEWFLVNEQFGRVTNGLHWHVPSAYNVLMRGTPSRSSAIWSRSSRRGRRRLRGDRGRGRFGPGRDRRHRGPHRRRLQDQRREVVRDLRRRGRGADRDGRRGRRRAAASDPVPGRAADPRRRVHRQPAVHPQLPPWLSDDRLLRRRGRAGGRDRRRGERRGPPAGLVHRGAPRHRHPRAGAWGGCSPCTSRRSSTAAPIPS